MDLSSVKKKLMEEWKKLEPKKQKKVVSGFLILLVLVLSYMGYTSTHKNKPATAAPKKQVTTADISLEPDLVEKSIYAQVNEKMAKQEQLIGQLKKAIDDLKARQAKEAVGPGSARPFANSKPEPGQLNTPTGSQSLRHVTPPKTLVTPPPVGVNVPPPPVSVKPEPLIIGDISFIENTDTGKVGRPREDSKKNEGESVYLPPSFMAATLLSGIDAPTMGAALKNPIPVLFRIKDLAVLPNRVKANLKGCFVIGEGIGNLSDERVHIRLLTLSCVARNGSAVIDQKVSGFVEDEDGKVGLKGTVVAKMGSMLARSALAGLFGGAGDALKDSATTTQVTGLGTTNQLWTDTDKNNLIRGGVGGGLSEASKSLQKFYLDLAKQTMPVIEVGSAKEVTLVVDKGVDLKIKTQKVGM